MVVDLIAHRGYARAYPENTLVAVEAALDVGARYVEIDVQLSRDRVPYLMHDRTLERMCGVPGTLSVKSSAEIELLRASEAVRFGSKFASEPVASLANFAAAIARRPDAHAFVEIKRAALEAFGADAVLDAVLPALASVEKRCTLISFDVGVLLRALARSSIPRGPVLMEWRQLRTDDIARMEPTVVFCDVDKLPRNSLRLDPLPKGCDLAVYEVDHVHIARDLEQRGVRFVETFAIGEMLGALKA